MKAALVALAALTASPAGAFDVTAMTEAERAAFGNEVRAYLLANPEVLIEVSQELDKKQVADQAQGDAGLIAANKAELFSDPASFVGGNPKGDVTVVEFLDYRCGYCRKAHAEVTALIGADKNIRYIVKEFPILGEESLIASKFAIAALRTAGPDAYSKISAGFYESFRGDITPDTLAAFAKTLGIDPKPILAAMDDPEVMKIIEANHELASRMQINGTPAFVIGGQMVRGYVPAAQLGAIVKDARG